MGGHASSDNDGLWMCYNESNSYADNNLLDDDV